MITFEELRKICPYTRTGRVAVFVEPLNLAMHEFEIDVTPVREAAFLAQVAHESGGLTYVREIASGAAYEGRADLGNTKPGDGEKFRGRGLIQVTGRSNYAVCGAALDLDLLTHPELLEQIPNAARSAGWFWKTHGLNELADHGDFKLITKRINGGYNGYKERLAFYETALEVLS